MLPSFLHGDLGQKGCDKAYLLSSSVNDGSPLAVAKNKIRISIVFARSLVKSHCRHLVMFFIDIIYLSSEVWAERLFA